MNRRHFVTSTLAASLATHSRAADSPKLRVAVIGHTGRGNYGHGIDTMWTHMPEVEIVAVADADETGLAGALKKLKVAKGYADYHTMLAEVKPDLVGIGPRHIDQHHAMFMAAIKAGARGVYAEKPFCRTLAEADEIIAAADQQGTRLAIAHRNRYHPVMPVVAQLVKDGAIGRLLEFRARGKEDQRGGSLDLWVLGGHLFNLIHFFGGAPLACSATVLQGGKPATKADIKEGDEGVGPLAGNEVHARFEMECGVPAFFDSVQSAGVKSTGFGIQLIGTEGIIDLRTDVEPAAQILKGSPFRPVKEPRTWVPITSGGIGVPEPLANIKEVMEHITAGRDLIASINEKREPLCSAKDARVTLEMVMGIFESHRVGGGRVELPLKSRDNPITRW
ncbi:MAG: Gfo/Idh/MocA family oxidoreductase [Verrucomicrobiaceae bacterium]|nr:Gfo/Idh/MocA family oxidoreductase [Verrucomicrobiaceae bacterium]